MVLSCPASLLFSQPEVYFNSAETLSGFELKDELHAIIDNHTRLSYTPGVWEAHKDLHEDPDDPSKLILFYSELSFDKSAQDPGRGSEEYWNREHLWPRSYGVGSSGSDNTDLFRLVPANKAVNNDRGNLYFDESNPSDGNFSVPGHPLAPNTSNDANSWEPGDQQKGWVARAMFYMDTRYEELQLVDTPPTPSTSQSVMAQLSVLLDWNRRFLPAEKETTFNERVYADYQGNRNPFISYPEFADAIWLGHPSWGAWRLQHFTLEELANPSISGDQADPDLDRIPNLVELALYSDPRTPEYVPALRVERSETGIEVVFERWEQTEHLNLRLLLESSLDGQSWQALDLGEADYESLGNGLEQVSLTLDPTQLAASRVYRLRAVSLSEGQE